MKTRIPAVLPAIPLALWVLAGASPGLAQVTGLADTTKQGSLLVWPLVRTTGGGQTYVTVVNHSPAAVSLKCFWEVKDVASNPKSQCLLTSFVLPLGGSTPLTFRASDGSGLDNRPAAAGMGAGEEGVLRCWAVDPSASRQISWNHLGGSATIVDRDNTAPGVTSPPTTGIEYSAWRFAANVIASDGSWADGFWVGPVAGVSGAANTLNLKASPTTVVDPAFCVAPDFSASSCSLPNAAYDACPKYLTFDFLANTSAPGAADGFASNSVAVAPCKVDLTGSALNLPTMLVSSLWNGKSVQVAGPSRCISADARLDLGALSTLRRTYVFRYGTLMTPAGRFRLEARANAACGADAVATPLLGVIWTRLSDNTGTIGIGASASGKETSDYGYILWQPGGAYYQSILRRR